MPLLSAAIISCSDWPFFTFSDSSEALADGISTERRRRCESMAELADDLRFLALALLTRFDETALDWPLVVLLALPAYGRPITSLDTRGG